MFADVFLCLVIWVCLVTDFTLGPLVGASIDYFVDLIADYLYRILGLLGGVLFLMFACAEVVVLARVLSVV